MSLFNIEIDCQQDTIPDLPDEEWRDVIGFEGYYKVSNLGRVKGLMRKIGRNRFVMPKLITPVGYRYKSVCLYRDNVLSNKLVHRLVAEAFVPNPNNLPEVDHKDTNALNNCASNLEWVTASDNHKHRLSDAQREKPHKRQVKCLETDEIFESISAAGRSVCADATQIIESIESESCCKGRTFVYADSLPDDPQKYVENAHAKFQNYHARPSMSNCVRVKIAETGQEFDSIASAARCLNCDTATIRNRIKAGRQFNGVTLVLADITDKEV